MSALYAELLKLSLAEKLQLLEDLWDSIATNPDEVPIPDWQLEELDRREEEQHRQPQVGSSWKDVKARIRSRND